MRFNDLQKHYDPWVNQPSPYIESLITALRDNRFDIHRSWMDPMPPDYPRDATILFVPPNGGCLQALVWDEETGHRTGLFLSGCQGQPTQLESSLYLGGGLLPSEHEVVRRLLGEVFEPQTVYRDRRDVRDGFDDTLATRP